MDTTVLGRTGITVSRMGLGCGGHSRLGLARGGTQEDAQQIVRRAIDLGINFIDTAESYGTEEAVGNAIRDIPREQVVISTKVGATWKDESVSPWQLRERVDGCLRRLQTDYVDVFHLHGVMEAEYAYAVQELAPVLVELKLKGKIRAIGITEAFIREPAHKMLTAAVQEEPWDVVMVGFNILNQSAREKIFPHTQSRGIGTLCMFAVRRALSQPEALRELVEGLIQEGKVDANLFDRRAPLGFLEDVAGSLQEAAYRYCRWEPGLDVVLSGTGNTEHLEENARSLSLPALPEPILNRLEEMFQGVDSVSGN